MKKKSDISRTKNALTLIAGVIIALMILSGQVSTSQYAASVDTTQSAEDESDDHPTTIVKSVEAVATSATVSITHQFYFIAEIILSEENPQESTHFELPKLSTFLTTLFRQIISPNAP